jgi:TP901 family phage tail tape measure protein
MAGGKIDILVEPDAKGFGSKLDSNLKSQTSLLGSIGKGVGLALAAGTGVAAVGLSKVIELGNQYSANLNELQAVSGATATQMAAVSKTSIALGNDLSLPGTSAADAAAAMLELTKGGLSVAQSMTAAKGTLQLAAAASVDAGTAAELQSKALNEFGLSADQAGHVADVLANTANSAAGSITDIGFALNYVGPVARGFNISIDDTAAAIGLLANKGIQGEQAGTSLRGVLASLASPSTQAAAALNTLGIKAFDSKGKFEGLDKLIGQLAAAQGKLTQAQFQSAAATAFGNEGLTTAVALASSGSKAFEDMQTAVSKQGGAADVASAKMKGLGGAIEGFQSQAETLAIDVYQKISPGLETLVRAGTTALGQLDTQVTNALDVAVATVSTFGPGIVKALDEKRIEVTQAAEDLLSPFVDGAEKAVAQTVGVVANLAGDVSDVAENAVAGLKPVAQAGGEVVDSLSKSGGVLQTAATGLDGLGSAASAASGLLKPAGDLVGFVVGAVASLPGPVQSAAVALVGLKIAQKALGDTQIPVISQLRQFSGEMRVQQDLGLHYGRTLDTMGAAAAAFNTSTIPAVAAARSFRDQVVAIRDGAAAGGTSVSTMSATISALAERSPLVASMRDAFESASKGAERFGATAGLAAAAGTGLKAAAGGLVSALGGPVGIAITAVTIGLSLLGEAQADAAKRSQQHTDAVDSLASALRDSSGAINENVRAVEAQAIQQNDSFKSATDLGVSLKSLTDIALGQGDALDGVRKHLQDVIAANSSGVEKMDRFGKSTGNTTTVLNDQGQKAKDLLDALGPLSTSYDDATKKNEALADATKDGSTPAMKDFAAAMGNIAKNGSDADTVLHNLREAFDALTGKQLDAQQAQADFNETIANATKNFKDAADGSKGFHDSLITDGDAVNIATDNGRKLNDALNQSKDGLDKVAKAAFDAARAQGDDLPTATQKAKDAAQAARDQFVDFATNALHLTGQEAADLADKYGLIPTLVATQIATPGMSLAQAQLIQLKQKFDEQPGVKDIKVTAPTDEAIQNLRNLGFTVTSTPGSKDVTVTANTQAAIDALNNYVANGNNKVITVKVHLQSDGSAVQYTSGGGRVAATNAEGNLLDFYAAGGLRPMRGGYATVVAPNTWRVIGDNMRSPEAYIPLDRSDRSVGILSEAASRMGFALMRMYASGGLATAGASGARPAPAVSAGATINQQVIVQDNRSAYETGRVAAAAITWQLRR